MSRTFRCKRGDSSASWGSGTERTSGLLVQEYALVADSQSRRLECLGELWQRRARDARSERNGSIPVVLRRDAETESAPSRSMPRTPGTQPLQVVPAVRDTYLLLHRLFNRHACFSRCLRYVRKSGCCDSRLRYQAHARRSRRSRG